MKDMTMNDLIPLSILAVFLIFTKFRKRPADHSILPVRDSTCLKGLMAFFILFCHLSLFYSGPFLNLFRFLSNPAVGVFFFLSGHGLMYQYLRRPDYRKGFLGKRVSKIVLPYVFVTVLYWFFYRINGTSYSLLDIISRIITFDPIASYSWYIIEIIILYLFFYLFMSACGRNGKMMVMANGLLYVGIMVLGKTCGLESYLYRSTHMYVAGMAFALYQEKITVFLRKYAKWTLAASALIFFALFGRMSALFVSEAAFMLLILSVNCLVEYEGWLPAAAGKYSLEIYLLHGLAIKAVRMFLTSEDSPIAIIMIILVALTGSFLLNRGTKLLDRLLHER